MLRIVSLACLLTAGVAFGAECPRAAASHVALVRLTSVEVTYDARDVATTFGTFEVERFIRGTGPSSVRLWMEGGPSRDGQYDQYSPTSGLGAPMLRVGVPLLLAWTGGPDAAHPRDLARGSGSGAGAGGAMPWAPARTPRGSTP